MIRVVLPAVTDLVRPLPVVTKTTTVISTTQYALHGIMEAVKHIPRHRAGTLPVALLPPRIAIMPGPVPIAAVPITMGTVLRQVGRVAKAATQVAQPIALPVIHGIIQRPVPALTALIAQIIRTALHVLITAVLPTIKAGVTPQTPLTRPHGSLPTRTTPGVRLLLTQPITAIQAGEAAP